MQRITELCTKLRSSQTTKISQLILEAMAITQEEVITIEEDTMVKEDTPTKVDIKSILQQGQDVGYDTKKIISMQIVLIKIELTYNIVILVEWEITLRRTAQ